MLLNEKDRRLIKNMEEGLIYHEHQPDEPPHERQFCAVCQDYKRYDELVRDSKVK